MLSLAILTGCQRQLSEEQLFQECSRLSRNGDVAKAIALLESHPRPGVRLKILQAELLFSSRLPDRGMAILRTVTEPQDTELRARYLMNMAYGLYQQKPEDPAPRQYVDRAIELARRIGPSETLAVGLFRKAYVYGFPPESESWLREAGEIGRKLDDGYLEAWSLLDTGYLYLSTLSECDRALPFLLESEIKARRAGARRLENRAIGNSGNCYFHLGDLESAEKSFRRALEIVRESGDRSVIFWLNDLGLVNQYRGDLGPAEELYEEAGRMALDRGDRREYVRTVLNRTMTALDRGDAARAAGILKLAESEQMDAAQKRRFQIHFARIEGMQGRTQPALDLFHKIIPEAEQANDFGILWLARMHLSELLRTRGMIEDATREYMAAIRTVQAHWSSLSDDRYRFTLIDGLRVLYSRVVDFFDEQQQPAEAHRIAEAGRARLLAERVGRQTSGLDARIERPRNSTVYLSYWLGKQRSLLWIQTADEFHRVALPDEKTITSLVDRYMSAVREGADVLESEHPAGAELFRLLVEPARRLIPRNGRVVLSLDRSLHNLSFAVLPVYAGDQRPHFWVEDVRISIAPSLLLLRDRPAKDFRSDPILLVGDPVPVEGFVELKHLSAEIKRIAAKVDPARLRVLTRQDATAERYLAAAPESYAVIHFAAHATANRDSPLDSAIILSPDGERSKLYARDLVRRTVSTPLVCISACESAGARAYSGEGLVGFAWAFLQAGAENVVAGLWEADDAGTDQLMDEFYSGIFDGMPVDAALQRAQRKLIQSPGRFRLPYYWGLFQVYSLRGY